MSCVHLLHCADRFLHRLAPCVKGLLAVMRGLPEHSVHERKQILESLEYLVRRCFLRNQASKVRRAPPPSNPLTFCHPIQDISDQGQPSSDCAAAEGFFLPLLVF